MGQTLNLSVCCEKNPNFVSKICHVTDAVRSLRQRPPDSLCKTLTNTTIITIIITIITNKNSIYKAATQFSLIPGGSCYAVPSAFHYSTDTLMLAFAVWILRRD